MSATRNTTDTSVDLSTLLLPVAGELLVVPSDCVVEIIRMRPLERHEGDPRWLLGRLPWRGQQLRVLSFEALNNDSPPSDQTGSRLVILDLVRSTTAEGPRHYALLTHGVPHLMRLTPGNLLPMPHAVQGPAERMKIRLFDQDGAIPDLDYLERHAVIPLGS